MKEVVYGRYGSPMSWSSPGSTKRWSETIRCWSGSAWISPAAAGAERASGGRAAHARLAL
jgi:hypothetical protein